MKLTKAEKNQNPKLYGYGSLEELLADPTRFGDDPENPQTHWISFQDADGDWRFVPCTEEFFHWHRNEERNEIRRKDTESRCIIHSDTFGLIKCRADCSVCPKVRDGLPISIDYMRENYDLEFSDGSFEAEQEKRAKEECKELMWSLVNELNETDQQILKLFNEGKSDSAIAAIVRKSRSTVQEQRIKAIEQLKEKMKKITD